MVQHSRLVVSASQERLPSIHRNATNIFWLPQHHRSYRLFPPAPCIIRAPRRSWPKASIIRLRPSGAFPRDLGPGAQPSQVGPCLVPREAWTGIRPAKVSTSPGRPSPEMITDEPYELPVGCFRASARQGVAGAMSPKKKAAKLSPAKAKQPRKDQPPQQGSSSRGNVDVVTTAPDLDPEAAVEDKSRPATPRQVSREEYTAAVREHQPSI